MAKNRKYTIEELDNLLESNPNNVDLYLKRAEEYDIMGFDDKAINDYTKAINIVPNNSEFYIKRAYVYFYKIGNYEKALADYTTAINLSENDAIYYGYRAEAYYLLKEYQKAENDYKKAIELGEKTIDIFINRGDCLTKKIKDYNEALRNYNDAIMALENNELPKEPGWEEDELYQRRGIINEILKNYDDAINDYKKTKHILYEGSEDTIYDKKIKRIRYKQQINELDKKIQELDKKISEKKDDKNLYVERIKYYCKIVDLYEKTEIISNEIDDSNERDLPITFSEKEINENRKIQFNKAIKDYTKMLALDSKDYTAHKERGDLYLLINKYKEALTDYTEYLKMQPNDKNAEFDVKILKILTEDYILKDGHLEYELQKDELPENLKNLITEDEIPF